MALIGMNIAINIAIFIRLCYVRITTKGLRGGQGRRYRRAEQHGGGPIMRLLIAMMKHETNTFSPVPTPLARFGLGPGPLYRGDAIRAFAGTGTGLGAYLDLARREGADIVLPIAAGAPPSGPVADEAYAHITEVICAEVAKGGFDGILLDLHGAMVTESCEDGEGALLERIRAIDPHTPIAVSYDMHANLYD